LVRVGTEKKHLNGSRATLSGEVGERVGRKDSVGPVREKKRSHTQKRVYNGLWAEKNRRRKDAPGKRG